MKSAEERKKITVHLVNHTHWDREWYFSDQDSLVLSDLLFSNIILELEKQPQVNFVLDGQLSVLDEYLELHPENFTRIRRLVEKGQLQIGPWYTQPDTLHLNGESLLRNGIIGNKKAQKYGQSLKVGYLPDTFGFNCQLPVIFNELEMNSFVFWRGLDPDKTKSFYFRWRSLGGNRVVTAINMPQGYGTGMLLQPNKAYIKGRLDPAVKFIEDQLINNVTDVVIPVGNDQLGLTSDLERKVKQINELGEYKYIISDFPNFIARTNENTLREYVGEFLDPVFARIHRSCGSSRMDIKIAAATLENLLLYQVEPLMVIGKKCGINLSNELLTKSWEKLLESQAHDSLAGSIVDSVATDILHRLKEGTQLAQGIINTIQRLISVNLKLNGHQILLTNPLPQKRTEYYEVRVITNAKNIFFEDVEDMVLLKQEFIPPRENILKQTSAGQEYVTEPGYYISNYLVKTALPGLGYKVISFYKKESRQALSWNFQESAEIKGATVKIWFSNGHLYLTRESETISDFLTLQDCGNEGDTYDFSPLKDDPPITLYFDQATVHTQGAFQKMVLCGETKLPLNLTERQQNKYTHMFKYAIEIQCNGTDQLKIKLHFKNNIDSHQLTLAINTGIQGEVIAAVPFGFLKREQIKIPTNWKEKYAEKPINYWPLDGNITISDASKSLTVFTSEIKEYRQENERLLLTLLATTNQLGKPDLVNRPGRASGDTTNVGHPLIPTPQAQLKQSFEFNFEIDFSEYFKELEIALKQNKLNFKTDCYQKQELNLFYQRLDNKLQDNLAPQQQLLKEKECFCLPKNLVISACYPCYSGDDQIILRISNPTKQRIEFKLPLGASVVDALENERKYDGSIEKYDVLTLKIDLHKNHKFFRNE
ncbi:hypothetical protein [Liquorilactobacillus satsumensis]|uniref:glycoside hydrolase family 38 N-terminal domain-containing protein n=1 Tax=Liquorilactobacillus satsumensis TaxID=259059 RepID=UPI0039EC2F86